MKTLLWAVLAVGLVTSVATAGKIATNEMTLPDDRLDEVELLEGKIAGNDLLQPGQLSIRVSPPKNSKGHRPGKTKFFTLEGYTGPVGHELPISVYVWCKAEKVYVAVKLTPEQRRKIPATVHVLGR